MAFVLPSLLAIKPSFYEGMVVNDVPFYRWENWDWAVHLAQASPRRSQPHLLPPGLASSEEAEQPPFRPDVGPSPLNSRQEGEVHEKFQSSN